MDHQLVAAVEGQDDEFEQSASRVEAEAQLTRRRVVVEILDPDRRGTARTASSS
ncbi:hypothetical protein [Rathayibacter rathayi]|uniref:hypothetical protein n=1 Tax=Rathayibacter rathayi TaxID=33887 RepID=UPI0015E1EC89